ncbi:hypothetical protein RQP53_10070 [Paucibacter sp. APW11]|uniref:Uncharacterized protein n=1 Tax=Roseateles aquae TaxID=3077235 RepID=A0ABU3PAJ8_9BURK|nr:hypothetical protein [Paucibacter sp. APW11]MDT8999610.1 hypothetical protein [Paucibacter sp. APW11]
MSSVTSVSAAGAMSTGSVPVSLDAERAKCEIQLADWSHCGSAKTPEGKAKIDALSEQLATIKARMQRAQAAHNASQREQRGSTPAAPAANGLGAHVDLYA